MQTSTSQRRRVSHVSMLRLAPLQVIERLAPLQVIDVKPDTPLPARRMPHHAGPCTSSPRKPRHLLSRWGEHSGDPQCDHGPCPAGDKQCGQVATLRNAAATEPRCWPNGAAESEPQQLQPFEDAAYAARPPQADPDCGQSVAVCHFSLQDDGGRAALVATRGGQAEQGRRQSIAIAVL